MADVSFTAQINVDDNATAPIQQIGQAAQTSSTQIEAMRRAQNAANASTTQQARAARAAVQPLQSQTLEAQRAARAHAQLFASLGRVNPALLGLGRSAGVAGAALGTLRAGVSGMLGPLGLAALALGGLTAAMSGMNEEGKESITVEREQNRLRSSGLRIAQGFLAFEVRRQNLMERARRNRLDDEGMLGGVAALSYIGGSAAGYAVGAAFGGVAARRIVAQRSLQPRLARAQRREELRLERRSYPPEMTQALQERTILASQAGRQLRIERGIPRGADTDILFDYERNLRRDRLVGQMMTPRQQELLRQHDNYIAQSRQVHLRRQEQIRLRFEERLREDPVLYAFGGAAVGRGAVSVARGEYQRITGSEEVLQTVGDILAHGFQTKVIPAFVNFVEGALGISLLRQIDRTSYGVPETMFRIRTRQGFVGGAVSQLFRAFGVDPSVTGVATGLEGADYLRAAGARQRGRDLAVQMARDPETSNALGALINALYDLRDSLAGMAERISPELGRDFRLTQEDRLIDALGNEMGRFLAGGGRPDPELLRMVGDISDLGLSPQRLSEETLTQQLLTFEALSNQTAVYAEQLDEVNRQLARMTVGSAESNALADRAVRLEGDIRQAQTLMPLLQELLDIRTRTFAVERAAREAQERQDAQELARNRERIRIERERRQQAQTQWAEETQRLGEQARAMDVQILLMRRNGQALMEADRYALELARRVQATREGLRGGALSSDMQLVDIFREMEVQTQRGFQLQEGVLDAREAYNAVTLRLVEAERGFLEIDRQVQFSMRNGQVVERASLDLRQERLDLLHELRLEQANAEAFVTESEALARSNEQYRDYLGTLYDFSDALRRSGLSVYELGQQIALLDLTPQIDTWKMFGFQIREALEGQLGGLVGMTGVGGGVQEVMNARLDAQRQLLVLQQQLTDAQARGNVEAAIGLEASIVQGQANLAALEAQLGLMEQIRNYQFDTIRFLDELTNTTINNLGNIAYALGQSIAGAEVSWKRVAGSVADAYGSLFLAQAGVYAFINPAAAAAFLAGGLALKALAGALGAERTGGARSSGGFRGNEGNVTNIVFNTGAIGDPRAFGREVQRQTSWATRSQGL